MINNHSSSESVQELRILLDLTACFDLTATVLYSHEPNAIQET